MTTFEFTHLMEQSLKMFLDLLDSFDRYYSYSDDIRVWRAGKAQDDQIELICKHPDFQAVYAAWKLYHDVPATPESTARFEEAQKVLLFRATRPEETVDQPPTEDDPSLSVTTHSDEFALPADENKPFTNAADFLQDHEKAKLYVLGRAVDAINLLSEMKWVRTHTIHQTACYLYTIRIFKATVTDNASYNIIMTKNGEMRYATELCMLAYILAAYW